MARPKKLNVEFFSHDVDMRNDLKVKALRRKHGHAGYSFFNMILEILGDCDYFEYQWNELKIELLSPEVDLDSEEIIKIVNYCVKLDLLQIQNGYLTCNKFTERLMSTLINARDGFSMENSKRTQFTNSLPTENHSLLSINTQSRVEYSIGEETIGELSTVPHHIGEVSTVENNKVNQDWGNNILEKLKL